jgi:hypothetical protein
MCQTRAVVTEQRRKEVRAVVQQVDRWAATHDDVRGVVLVGSWARGTARADSDVDIVVLTDTTAHAEAELWSQLLNGRLIRQRWWGPLREVRLQRSSGFEVEMGIVPLSWADIDPVDAGTFRVINDGHQVIYDPDKILAALSAACR